MKQQTVLGMLMTGAMAAVLSAAPETGNHLDKGVSKMLAVPSKALPRPVDLAPVSLSDPLFCDRPSEGSLRVTVQTLIGKPRSVLAIVVFRPGGPRSVVLQSPGTKARTRTGLVPIPNECWNPDCDFTIFVDPNEEVPETNEGNNEAAGRCIG